MHLAVHQHSLLARIKNCRQKGLHRPNPRKRLLLLKRGLQLQLPSRPHRKTPSVRPRANPEEHHFQRLHDPLRIHELLQLPPDPRLNAPWGLLPIYPVHPGRIPLMVRPLLGGLLHLVTCLQKAREGKSDLRAELELLACCFELPSAHE